MIFSSFKVKKNNTHTILVRKFSILFKVFNALNMVFKMFSCKGKCFFRDNRLISLFKKNSFIYFARYVFILNNLQCKRSYKL